MSQLKAQQQGIRENFPAVVLAMVAGGFALTVVELLMMHHTEGKQLIGVAATGVGALLALVGIWAKGGAKTLLVGTFAVLALSGVFGMVEHLEGEEEEREGFRWQQPAQAWLTSHTVAFADEERHEREEEEGEKGEHGPPPLAPLSVTGLALLGAAALIAKPD